MYLSVNRSLITFVSIMVIEGLHHPTSWKEDHQYHFYSGACNSNLLSQWEPWLTLLPAQYFLNQQIFNLLQRNPSN